MDSTFIRYLLSPILSRESLYDRTSQAAGDASVALWQIDKQVDAVMTEDIRVLVFGAVSLFHTYVFSPTSNR